MPVRSHVNLRQDRALRVARRRSREHGIVEQLDHAAILHVEHDVDYLKSYYAFLSASHRGGKTAEERLADAADELRKNYDKFVGAFTGLKSKISGPSGMLRQAVANPALRDRIDIKTEENAEGLSCFGLFLEPNQIEIVESE